MSRDLSDIDDAVIEVRLAVITALCRKLRYRPTPVLAKSLLEQGASTKKVLREISKQQSTWIRLRNALFYAYRHPIAVGIMMIAVVGAGIYWANAMGLIILPF